jgi:hypothetical protein
MAMGGPQVTNMSAAPSIDLKPGSYEKIVLGRVGIFSYATNLEVEIAYSAGSGPVNRTLRLRRLTTEDIQNEMATWKGLKTKVPAFFPD